MRPIPRTNLKGSVTLATIAFAYILFAFCGLSEVDLTQPLTYQGDALEMYSYFGRDYSVNDLETRLFAPFGQTKPNDWDYIYNALFQSNSNIVLAAYLITRNAVTASNLYYVLTYFLAFFTSYFVLGRLRMRDPFRFGAAALYALMPFHFQRGMNHLFESSYFLTPLMILVLLWIWSERSLFWKWKNDRWKFSLVEPRALFAIVLVTFFTSFHYYHQFFFALLAACSAALAAIHRRSPRHLLSGLLIAAIAVAALLGKGIVLGLLKDPELTLSLTGKSIGGYGEAEQYPLKIIQILLPVQGHRWTLLAHLRQVYDGSHPLINENSTVSLGVVGAIGFLMVLIAAFLPRKHNVSVYTKFGILTVITILIAGMGGLSSVLSTTSLVLFGPNFELTQARGWNRMIVFVGFFAYAAFFLFLQQALGVAGRRWRAISPQSLAGFALGVMVIAFALWDQVPFKIKGDPAQAARYQADIRFFGEIEKQQPGATVLQLPLVIQHWTGEQNGIHYTDGLRPFLASRSLKFSYGGDKDSEQVRLLTDLTSLPAPTMLQEACRYGFDGVLLHRKMLKDPRQQEAVFAALLGAPQISQHEDFAYFRLGGYCRGHGIKEVDVAKVEASLLADLNDPHRARRFNVAEMPREVGEMELDSHGRACVVAGQGKTGFVSYGPYAELAPGRYEVAYDINALGASTAAAGNVDVAATQPGGPTTSLVSRKIVPNDKRAIKLQFEVSSPKAQHEFRVYNSGVTTLRLCGLTLKQLD